MDVILATVKWQLTLVYLEDIFILSKTPEEHIRHIREVSPLWSNIGVTLELEKSLVFTETIE